MKRNLLKSTFFVITAILTLGIGLTSCVKNDDGYRLKKEDIRVEVPQGGFKANAHQPFRIVVKSISDEGVSFKWILEDKVISTTKDLEYTFDKGGEYLLQLSVSQGETNFNYDFSVEVSTEPYILQQQDIRVEVPQDGFIAQIGQPFTIEVISVSDEGLTYQWLVDGAEITEVKNIEYVFQEAGQYELQLSVSQNEITFTYDFSVRVSFGEVVAPSPDATAYITKVLDFMPAVGQFTNELPKYELGDTQEKMNEKVLKSIGNNKKGMISLGGFGGYVVVGFDHTIANVVGKRDFRVIANAFYSAVNPDSNAPEGGSCEPGVIMVAYDINKNGVPDENEWYEIAGSSHIDPKQELWYSKAVAAGNDVRTHFDYEITYHRPTQEPTTAEGKLQYIRWEDNQGKSGYKVKNAFHNQCYYPLWASGDQLTFKGTCLPENGIDESGQGSYYVLYKFLYGYADNETNTKDEAAIDIEWAVNRKGQKVNMPGVDFIKIYTGVNQENGWLGECSTEITGVEDLHILGVDIDTRK